MATPTTTQPADSDAPRELATARTLLTVEAAATHLSIGRTTMYALLKNGAITSIKVGRLRRVPAEALTTYTARLISEQTAA